jgi:hypothetical protein
MSSGAARSYVGCGRRDRGGERQVDLDPKCAGDVLGVTVAVRPASTPPAADAGEEGADRHEWGGDGQSRAAGDAEPEQLLERAQALGYGRRDLIAGSQVLEVMAGRPGGECRRA